MRVSLVQAASTTDPRPNRERLAEFVRSEADLVVLPEAWARDFGKPGTDVSAEAETLDGPFVTALDRLARENSTTIVAGMFERADDPGRPFNTLVLRGAANAEYRKVHLYDSFGFAESDRLTAGPIEFVTAALGDFTLGLMTCYDLRFPEFARGLVAAGADVLVLPAAWVAGPLKVDHWRTLVRARAIENTCFVVAVGQPGPRYTGHSMVVAPDGEILAEAGEAEQTFPVELEHRRLVEARRTNPSLGNRRL